MKDLFNTFALGLVPYRVKNSIFFHPPVNKHGVGMVMPNVDWIDGKPIYNGVIIPRRIDITYDYYKKLCKAFAKLNIRKYRLKTESNPDKQSFFINLLDEKINVDWRLRRNKTMNMNIKNNTQYLINFLTIQQELFSCLDFYVDENSGTAKVCVQCGKENELYKLLLNFKEVEKNLNSVIDDFSRVLLIPIEDAKFPSRVKTTLLKNNIKTLGELINLMKIVVQKIPQLGWKSFNDLIANLKRYYGLKLKEY